MERHLELRETREWYQVGIDAGQLEREPIVLEKDGAPVAAVISFEEFRAYQEWKTFSTRRQIPQYFTQDKELFREWLPKLLETHRNKWIAIYHGEMIDEADTSTELTRRVYDKYGYHAIYMDQVTEPRVYRMPSIRVVRP
ncbi:hypothetical protein FBQ82_05640 [Anaerolineae bacterium CFX7]|nr:hypothetical protein [Anaerolineae bacterium CFX7]